MTTLYIRLIRLEHDLAGRCAVDSAWHSKVSMFRASRPFQRPLEGPLSCEETPDGTSGTTSGGCRGTSASKSGSKSDWSSQLGGSYSNQVRLPTFQEVSTSDLVGLRATPLTVYKPRQLLRFKTSVQTSICSETRPLSRTKPQNTKIDLCTILVMFDPMLQMPTCPILSQLLQPSGGTGHPTPTHRLSKQGSIPVGVCVNRERPNQWVVAGVPIVIHGLRGPPSREALSLRPT